MADNLQLNVKVAVIAKGFKAQIDAIKKHLDKLRGATKEAGDAADEAGREIDGMGNSLNQIGAGGLPAGVGRIGKEADTARQKVKGLNSGLGTLARRLGAIAAGYVGFHAVRGIGRQVDAYTELNNRIRLVADSEAELTGIRDKLFAISLRTRSSVAANAQLYSRLAQASKDLGTSQADLLKVTEILNKQVLIGGNNATEAAAGLVQFAQGVASGRLQGDELRSVMENLLGVQQGLIDGFKILYDTGQIDFQVTRSNLRKLASEGVLDADLLLKALLAVADKTEERFEQVAVTIGGAFQNLFTAIFGQLGLVDEGTSAGAGFASAINALAELIRPDTQSEKLAKSVRDQLRKGQVDPQNLSLAVLQGVQDLETKELNRIQEKLAAGVQLNIVEHFRLGLPNNGAELQQAVAAVERELAAREKLIRVKKQEVELNARLAPKDLGKYKPSDAVAAIGTGLQTDEERIRAEDRRQRAILEKDLQEARQGEATARQRLAAAQASQAASRVNNLAPQIEEAKDSLQSFADGVAEIEKNLGRLDEQTASRLANLPEAQERAQAEAQALRERLRALDAARTASARRARQVGQQFRKDSDALARIIKDGAKKLDDAIASIEQKKLDFLNPFERERVELQKWQQETLATLRKNAAAYAQYRAQVEGIVAKSLDDIAKREREAQRQAIEERIKNSREAAVGLLRGLEEYARDATNQAKHVQEAFKNAFENIEDQLVRLLTKGKFSFRQFSRDLAEDLARATIRVGVTGPIAANLGARLRGRLGLTAPATAKDAVEKLNTDLMDTQRQIIDAGDNSAKKLNDLVTAGGKEFAELQSQTALLKRIADCSCGADQRLQQLRAFRAGGDGGGAGGRLLEQVLGQVISNRVQRFHSGGVVRGRQGAEVLTLLEGGEVVRTRRQEAALAARGAGGPPQQVQVVVENRGANQQEVVEQRAEVEGSRLVVNLALEDIGRRGPLSQGLERTYGLRRRTG